MHPAFEVKGTVIIVKGFVQLVRCLIILPGPGVSSTPSIWTNNIAHIPPALSHLRVAEELQVAGKENSCTVWYAQVKGGCIIFALPLDWWLGGELGGPY